MKFAETLVTDINEQALDDLKAELETESNNDDNEISFRPRPETPMDTGDPDWKPDNNDTSMNSDEPYVPMKASSSRTGTLI